MSADNELTGFSENARPLKYCRSVEGEQPSETEFVAGGGE